MFHYILLQIVQTTIKDLLIRLSKFKRVSFNYSIDGIEKTENILEHQ